MLSGRSWLRVIRRALAFVTLVVFGLMGVAMLEGARWRREANAQCQDAKPLVAAHAGLSELRRIGRGPSTESSFEESGNLVRQFGAESDKAGSIGRNLRQGQRVLVYSESNSVMLVYLDAEGKAFRAECFLQ